MKLNIVQDQMFVGGNNLVYCHRFSGDPNSILITNNYWGSDNPSNQLFFPDNAYTIEPTWEIGDDLELLSDPAENLYNLGLYYFNNDNYNQTNIIMKNVIDIYPDTKYAKWAAEFLLKNEKQLNRGFSELQDFYLNNENLHLNEDISNLADYLANYCNIFMGDYNSAIAWYENLLNDSPSEQDSIYAVLDLGYIYLLMNEGRSNKNVNSKYPKFCPRSRSEYEDNRKELLTVLYETTEYDPQYLKEVFLSANFPNPFNPKTTIEFGIPEDMKNVKLTVFNIKGQKVKTLYNGPLNKGKKAIIWDSRDNNNKLVSSGVYFYKLETSNKSKCKKMLLLR